MNFWTGEACYVRGVKNRRFGLFWVTIVTDAASRCHLGSDEASNTFLVLGPIDLTNGRAGMVHSLTSTLRGIGCLQNVNSNKRFFVIIQDSVLSASSECL
jgi:hypothetical protein